MISPFVRVSNANGSSPGFADKKRRFLARTNGAWPVMTASPAALRRFAAESMPRVLQSPSFSIHNSSFQIQSSSLLVQNSSFLLTSTATGARRTCNQEVQYRNEIYQSSACIYTQMTKELLAYISSSACDAVTSRKKRVSSLLRARYVRNPSFCSTVTMRSRWAPASASSSSFV